MRPSAKLPVVALVTMVVATSLLELSSEPGRATVTEGRGSWVVTGQETLSNSIDVWNGNITVAQGGELLITGCVLMFNSTSSAHQGIMVEAGGKIVMNGVRLMTTNVSEGLLFIANGSVNIKNCRIENIYASGPEAGWVGGFRITSDDPVIEDSTILNSTGFGPRFEGCENVVFRNNRVFKCSTGVIMEGSTGTLEGNTFTNNSDRQVLIRGCDGVQFLNNVINLTGLGGLVVTRSKNIETSGNRYDGEFYVVYVSNHSTITMFDEIITGGQVHVEARGDSKVALVDSFAEINKVRAFDESEVVSSRTVRIKVTSGNRTVAGAMVTVKDSEKLLVTEGETDEGGLVEFVLVEALITAGTGTQPNLELMDPYRLSAVKGIYSASGTVNVSRNTQIVMQMSLPWLFIGVAAVVVVLVVVIVITPPGGKRRKPRKRG